MDNENQPTAGGSKTGMWVALIIAVIVLGVGAYFLFARENGTNANNSNVVVNENANSAFNSNANATANANRATNENTPSNTNLNNALTANWTIYNSDQYNFSIKYPATGSVTSNSVYNPLIQTGVDGCSFNFNGQGLGRGISLTRIPDSSAVVNGETLTVKQYTCTSGNLCLKTIQLTNNVSIIELGFPDSEDNKECSEILDLMLSTYSTN